VSDTQPAVTFEVDCPHCHKTFSGSPIEGSAARYHGFKCPHCKLFVPYARVEEQVALEPLMRDPDAVA
jgi:phage FluMu protein Com